MPLKKIRSNSFLHNFFVNTEKNMQLVFYKRKKPCKITRLLVAGVPKFRDEHPTLPCMPLKKIRSNSFLHNFFVNTEKNIQLVFYKRKKPCKFTRLLVAGVPKFRDEHPTLPCMPLKKIRSNSC
jgi:hypothetical protein